MRFEEAAALVQGIPIITPARGRVLYDFVRSSGVRTILELGFAHGTSTCYLAAALDEARAGHITTIDLREAERRDPNIYQLLEKTALGAYVTPVFANRSYTWELMKEIEARTVDGRCAPVYDFVFIDGAHTWETDGAAFFLADKLLRPGGWVLFDDLDWSFASSPTLADEEWVRAMPDDERTTAQVGKVFALLVKQHPDYGHVESHDGWGWAQKTGDADDRRIGDGSVVIRDAYTSERSIREDLRLLVGKIVARKIRHA